MSKKPRRKISDETKSEILEAYISGAKSASELALEHNISAGQIYQWKSDQAVKDLLTMESLLGHEIQQK